MGKCSSVGASTTPLLRTLNFFGKKVTLLTKPRKKPSKKPKDASVYRTFVQDYLAVPVISGEKTASERFPGALRTYCLEAMMQDRKALQATTSHFLGQNFAKAFGIEFQSRDGKLEHAWTTSWGATTDSLACSSWFMVMTMEPSYHQGLQRAKS